MEYIRSNPEVNRLHLVSPPVPPTDSALTILNDIQLSGVTSGATYLHDLGVVHGDLKGVLSNVHNPSPRLADRLSRQTFSLTTMGPPDLGTLVS